MIAAQLRPVIAVALTRIGKWSQAAENLVLGTAAHESGGFRYRRQINGPALGLWQIEPVTHDDVRSHWFARHPEIISELDTFLTPGHDAVDQLVDNDAYAAGICRLKYAIDPAPLPSADDIPGLAATWKRVYNTRLGKGTEEQFIGDYRLYVLEGA